MEEFVKLCQEITKLADEVTANLKTTRDALLEIKEIFKKEGN